MLKLAYGSILLSMSQCTGFLTLCSFVSFVVNPYFSAFCINAPTSFFNSPKEESWIYIMCPAP